MQQRDCRAALAMTFQVKLGTREDEVPCSNEIAALRSQ